MLPTAASTWRDGSAPPHPRPLSPGGERGEILDEHRRGFFLVDYRDFRRAVQIAFAVGSAEAQLAIRVQVVRWDCDSAGRFDDEQIGVGVEFDSVRRRTRDHDIIAIAERQRAE